MTKEPEIITDSKANQLLIETRSLSHIDAIKYIFLAGYFLAKKEHEDNN